MQSLDAALAFGITMLVLAMLVTTLVETLHRIVGLREKGLAILLANFYERVLVVRGVGRPGDAQERRAFVDMMTLNRGPAGMIQLPRFMHRGKPDTRPKDRRFLNWIWSGRRLGSISTEAFMERLGSSPYGGHLVMQVRDTADDGLEVLLKDLVQKFDAFGREASEYFESRARLLSVIVGFVVAAALNVNAIVLFDTFMKRPDVTNAVIENGADVTRKYESLTAETQKLAATADQATKDASSQAPADSAAAQKQIEELRAQVRKAADEADAAVKNLGALGVPIGWNIQKYDAFKGAPAMPALGLLLGGLLIGLGAPFWYRAVQTLTGVRNASRSRQDAAAATQAATLPSAPHQPPATSIEAFYAAFGAVAATGNFKMMDEAVG